MNYDNSSVRRQDRLMDEEQAIEILKNGEYGYLSLVDSEGIPYGIPISYAFEGGSIYIHCGPAGRKIDVIGNDAPASFCVVGDTQVIPHKFTTNFESVVVSGRVHHVEDEEERWKCLRLILEKYSPLDMEIGLKYAEKSFFRTRVLRIDINSVTGKRKWISW